VKGSTVLNTRPREQAAELSRLLAAAGFHVVEAPAIETLSAWDVAELQAVRDDLAAGAYAWVVLPSQNAARSLELAHEPVLCGAATAQALGLTSAVKLARFNAAAALEVLKPMLSPGQRILVPRAAESNPALTDGLTALGAEVHAPIAYRTVAVEPRLLAGRLRVESVNAVTACSPSALHAVLAAVGRVWFSLTKLVCLGGTTAQAARQAGLRVDGVARTTSMAALVEAVVSVLDKPGVPA
jgi:uroporphyrinogen-III synthase